MTNKLKTFYQLKEENKSIHDFSTKSAVQTYEEQIAVMRDVFGYNKEIYSDYDVCNSINSFLKNSGKESIFEKLESAKSQYKSELQPTLDWVKWAFEKATNKNFDDYNAKSFNYANSLDILFVNINNPMYSIDPFQNESFFEKLKLIGFNEMVADKIFEDNDLCLDSYASQNTIDTDTYVEYLLDRCAYHNAEELANEINLSFQDNFDLETSLDSTLVDNARVCADIADCAYPIGG